MKTVSLKILSLFFLLLFSATMFSCKKELLNKEEEANAAATATADPNMKAGNIDLPGRTLAANCFQCHGTNGYAGELKIAGESKMEILSEINSMKTQNPRSNIMNVHAQAYTTEEMDLIADYFSKQ